ncbi:MAG: hypothetical protein ACMG57_01700 [Candidatus Dojkabacteria bacterium]
MNDQTPMLGDFGREISEKDSVLTANELDKRLERVLSALAIARRDKNKEEINALELEEAMLMRMIFKVTPTPGAKPLKKKVGEGLF